MKFVATKTADQVDLQALHRVRERLVSQRTSIINQIRAFIAVRQGLRFLRAELPGILAMRIDVLSPRMVRIIEDLSADWRRLDARIVSLFLVLVADHFRRVAKRLQDEEQLRQLAVQELAHRLKNKIATIQAIISIQLRDYTQVRNDILDRLAALTATDHLIEEANGRGAFIHDIAKTELGPYVAARVVIQGPNVLLPPKYALTVALLVHELATNSVKYGSLSVPNGIVSLNSRITDALLDLEWKEREGPPVSAPQKQGFGLRLLSRALAQLGGGTEILSIHRVSCAK